MKNRILFGLMIIGIIASIFANNALIGSHSLRIEVYDSATDGNLLWGRDFGGIEFIDGSPSINPTEIVREQYFGRDVVYAQLVIDGEDLSGDRIAITMSGSLMREHESMDEMAMGIQIGEPGNDVAVRSDRLVIGSGDPNEKVTVEGAVSIQEQDVPPGASTGFGKIFIDNTDNHLYYIDEAGTITDLTVDGNAVQSVSSSANPTGRMDHMRFIPGEATEITESATDDTIYIRYDLSCSGESPCTSAPTTPSSIDGATTICSGEPGASYAVAPVEGATYYRWTLPSGSVVIDGLGSNSIRAVFGNLDGNVCVKAVNACGESSDRCLAVTINRPTSPGSITGDALVCSGSMGVSYFIATVPDATNYIWTLPAGAVLASGTGSPSVTVNFASLGGDICVQTENSCGTSAPVCLPVTITDTPETPGVITGSSDVCSGETGVSYSVDAVAEATSYNWTVPSGASITAGAGTRSISVDFGVSSGNVSVSATSICGTSSARTLAVNVTIPPAAPGSISGSSVVPPDTEDESYSISAVTGATSYLWTVTGDATIDGSATGTSINVDYGSTPGASVDVCVAAINSCGTSIETCRTVTIAVPSGSTSFSYTGSEQTWTVPAGVSSVNIESWGAEGQAGTRGTSTGGNGTPGSAGRGGYATGDLSVTPGDVLYIYVGGQSGYNGGGTGGTGSGGGSYYPGGNGGNGGGASDVRHGGNSLSDRVIVAGGGGGGGAGGYYGGGSAANAHNFDGSNGASGGAQGNTSLGGTGGGAAGDGGDGSASGSSTGGPSALNGSNGVLGVGGDGGDNGAGGGGGGGGFYGAGGGGGGGIGRYPGGGGGGGGGSYYIGGVTSGSVSSASRTGNGEVIISW